MKKTRKQTALAKCVLATIMAMGMMGYTTVWADTPTPSPVDKTVSKDAAGQIYDAAYGTDGWNRKYFWTDLGHAQVQIGSGEQIELFTPFIYHTYNDQWNPQGNGYRPVHTGDNSEMQCKESMSNITVGEFDRIIKSLYTNDITMAKTIYGEAGQVGLKDTVIKAVRATPGQGKTVNTYELVRANDEVLAAAIVDTNTTNTGMEGSLDENGKLTVKVKDSDKHSVQTEVEGIASRSWVTNQLKDIAGTDTVTTVESATNMLKITDEGTDENHAYKVDINGDKLGDFVKQYDTNTITTAKSGHAIITVNDSVGGSGLDDKNYVIGIDEKALKGFIQDNTQDTNTVTTVAVNTNILTIEDNGEGSNHAYELGINSEQLNEAIEAQDRYVNGGSIGADGKITLNVRNGEGEDVKLDGQLKDAQLTEIERDKAAGTATLVVKDGYTNEEVRRLTIDDIASKAQNDKEHAEFREHFSELDHRVDNLGSRVDKVGAGAAALAALHPMDFDPDDKLTFAAGYGNYKGRNAAAVGAFYRPDEKVMLSVGGTFGNGENMVNAGISFSLDRTARVSNSRTAMAKEIVDLRANVANLTALVGQLTAGMGGTIEMDRMKLFPDVPENHWAYEYIGRLAAAGIVEGYPDGMFNGNRMMSRYEFAAMLYRALEKGVKLDHKLVREFEPEMGRIHVARISGADGDRGKIERVRVYGGDNRDHYGSKLK
ncbi:YadA-like family protein [Phascolarctobacterium succinatutens]|uniref:YadA-like family protein n=1 Tax=Phascolarctobacterium succinatutens TaxID=626940 RepID=UPI0024914BFD|nr:YadA-like family protein [Phascolarctobacterium succinatutens]